MYAQKKSPVVAGESITQRCVCNYVKSDKQRCIDSSSVSVVRSRQSLTPVDVTQWRTDDMRDAPRNSRPGTVTIGSVGYTTGCEGTGTARAMLPIARVAIANRVVFI